jgi:hypothetical protein
VCVAVLCGCGKDALHHSTLNWSCAVLCWSCTAFQLLHQSPNKLVLKEHCVILQCLVCILGDLQVRLHVVDECFNQLLLQSKQRSCSLCRHCKLRPCLQKDFTVGAVSACVVSSCILLRNSTTRATELSKSRCEPMQCTTRWAALLRRAAWRTDLEDNLDKKVQIIKCNPLGCVIKLEYQAGVCVCVTLSE